ncbi:MAG: DUF2752 domain-containing protein [Bacteroidetes bacterium]|nr:DUF2752 domain-containing protein [Bacteroidota bacterium]
MKWIINWLENHEIPCFNKMVTGFECPGCGMQRAFIDLIKGDFLASIKVFPALIPMLFMFFYLILFLKFNLKNGAVVLKYLFIFTASIMVLNYIFKLINHQI